MNFNATFFGQLIAFGVFVWFCMKFVWPLLLGMIEDREKRIADGLAAAEEGERKLEQAKKRLAEALEEGKHKAADIIAQAQKRGDEIIEESKQTARVEGERQLEAARQELRQQVAMLAIAGAEQILMREVDQNAHNEVLGKISADL